MAEMFPQSSPTSDAVDGIPAMGVPEDDACVVDPRFELSQYFRENKISVQAFIRSMREAKIDRFDEHDCSSALELMRQHDPFGERLLSLMAVTQLPESLRRWVWTAAEVQLGVILRAEISLSQQSPVELLTLLKRRFPKPPLSKEKGEIRGFIVGIKICMAFLVSKYRVPPFDAFRMCSSVLYANGAGASDVIVAAVRGSNSEFRVAAACGVAADGLLAERAEELDRMRAAMFTLESRLSDRAREIERLSSLLEASTLRNESLEADLHQVQAQASADRQHASHDLAMLKTKHAVLLRERLSPLIEDAIDALEISKPAPDIAIERMTWALSTIKESLA